ncbi:hypothetical protein B0H11DRAFT_1866205 [Mycena galericulata]|nr:hypothetical protein B0H11DRAFT_1866205 [Mycena galericulata]
MSIQDPEGDYQNHIVYRMLHTDFVSTLESNHLAYRYQLLLATLVNDMLIRVVADMEASPAQYMFPAARRASTSTGITTLQVLGLVDRGRVHKKLGVHARVEPHTIETAISDLAADNHRYSAEVSIHNKEFVIRVAVMGFPLLGICNGRRHSCVSSHIYSLFPCDSNTMGPSYNNSSGGESTDEGEDERMVLRSIPTPATSSPPLVPTRPVSPVTAAFELPPSIWDQNSEFDPNSSGEFLLDGFKAAVFEAATRGSGTVRPLRVRGADTAAAANHYAELIDDAGRREDYTNILVADRGFGFTVENALGQGPEREVLFTLLQRFFIHEAEWFQRVEEPYLTLRTLSSISVPVPPGRLVDFKRLGAICGLLMVFGQSPAPISPAIFQYLIHGGNLHALHPAFLGEWFPELRALLLNFLDTGPNGSLTPFSAHFATFHNIEANIPFFLLRFHLYSPHTRRLPLIMLFRAALGPTSFDCPEIQSFNTGFQLRCSNGFELPYAFRNFEGGSEACLSLIATSYISSADSLIPHLDWVNTAEHSGTYLSALRAHTGDIDLNFQVLVERFLRGNGVPCPAQFEASRGAFHRIVDLSRIDTPGFRSQSFVWAATGSPFIDIRGVKIKIGPIETHDETYALPGGRELLANNGTILFRTCFRTARYPVDYVLHLAEAQHSPESEPHDFQEAFDYWFLRQCLLAIGRYNML